MLISRILVSSKLSSFLRIWFSSLFYFRPVSWARGGFIMAASLSFSVVSTFLVDVILWMLPILVDYWRASWGPFAGDLMLFSAVMLMDWPKYQLWKSWVSSATGMGGANSWSLLIARRALMSGKLCLSCLMRRDAVGMSSRAQSLLVVSR